MDQIYPMKTAHERVSSDHNSNNGETGPKIETDSFADRDEREMAILGKKQQLKRNFGFMSILGFSCTLMVTWEGMFCVFVYGLTDGGPGGLVYGYIFCWLGYFAVVASLAELVSMAPTAGGQYHWVYLLAPPSSRKFLSYITGWQSIVAWQACLASAAYLGGTIIQGLLVLNYPNYVFERYQGTLLLYAVMALAVFFNTYLAKHLPKVEGAILIIHVVGFFAILITMTYLAPHGSPKDVFATFLKDGGYESMGLSFFVGIITTVFAFLGADGAIHMCEEIKNASTIVPWSLMTSIALNGTLGFAMLFAILFCIGDIDNALASPTGFPFIEIFNQATNSVAGATAMTSLILSLMIFATVAVLAAASRQMWAFARDRGVPGSRYIGQVEPRTRLPLYSIGLTTVITLLLALINIGSTEAFNAVASLLVAGFLASYSIPISLLFWKRVRGEKIHYGPWKLGKFGILANGFSLIWCIIALFFSFWPTAVPVTAQTMNWSCLLYGATMIFSVGFYIFYGRFRYNGPIVETSVVEQLHGV